MWNALIGGRSWIGEDERPGTMNVFSGFEMNAKDPPPRHDEGVKSWMKRSFLQRGSKERIVVWGLEVLLELGVPK